LGAITPKASGRPQITQSIETENLSRMKKTQENYVNGLIARAEYLKSMAYRAQRSQNFKLFGCPIFRFLAYLMKNIPETRGVH
jgi:hypothetical protein